MQKKSDQSTSLQNREEPHPRANLLGRCGVANAPDLKRWVWKGADAGRPEQKAKYQRGLSPTQGGICILWPNGALYHYLSILHYQCVRQLML